MTPTLHDASKVLMGSHGSSDFLASPYAADPASFPAGRAVRGKNDGGLSLISTDGSLVGVSMGKSLSDHKKTSVCRSGNRVPLELSGFAFLTKGDLTFYTKRNVAVAIEFLDTGSAGSEAITVTGDDDAGWLISISGEDGASTATEIKAALDAKAEAVALIATVITGTAGTAQSDFASDDIDGAVAVIGQAVRVSNADGKAVASGGTLTGAFYESAALSGVSETFGPAGSAEVIVPAAQIDMVGGL